MGTTAPSCRECGIMQAEGIEPECPGCPVFDSEQFDLGDFFIARNRRRLQMSGVATPLALVD
jgi:hypothetical protein